MILHYRTAEIFLHEASLQKTLFPTSPLESSKSHRIDMLYACLLSCQKALDHLFTQPLEHFSRLPVLQLSHLGHSLSTLVKLSLVDEIGWDLVQIRQRVNVVTYFEIFISKLEQVGAEMDLRHTSPLKRSLPSMCSRAMRKVKEWYETKISEFDDNLLQQSTAMLATDFQVDMSFLGDDQYWQDLMGSFDFVQ